MRILYVYRSFIEFMKYCLISSRINIVYVYNNIIQKYVNYYSNGLIRYFPKINFRKYYKY